MKTKFLFIISLSLSCFLLAQSGKNYELVEIQFIGNNAFSTSSLKSLISSKESPNWLNQTLHKISSIGGKAIYFDSLLIPNDLNILKGFYQSKGYFKIRINYHYNLDSSKNEAVLTYNIQEFQPAYFKSFLVKGLEWIDSSFQETLANYMQADTTTIYEDAIVDDKKNYILNFLRDHGYMLVQSDLPRVVIDTMKNSVDVELKFTTGTRYKIGEIFITRTGKGFDLVGDNLLKEVVALIPGYWYSNYDIQRGQVRLFRTNLFTSAAVNAIISDTAGNVVPINISADIGLMHELSPEIIINNEDNTFNLGLGLNLTKKNFLGGARKITVGTSIAAQNISEFLKHPSFADSTFFGYGDARVSIEQPFLFGEPINTKFETYLTTQKRKIEYNRAYYYQTTLYGGKLSMDFELPQFTYFNAFNAYLNIEHAEYSYKRDYLIYLISKYYQRKNFPQKIADSLAIDKLDKTFNGNLVSANTNATIGLNIGANKTNNLFFPTRGYSLSFLFEDANSIPYLFTKLTNTEFTRPLFVKAVVTSSVYLPLYESMFDAFGAKFKIGQIFTYHGDKANISLNQRLFAGGSNSVRGWATRELVPKNEEFNLDENLNQEDLEAILLRGAATGGFFLFEGSIETRNRLFGRFGSALFLDYGNTWNSSKEFRFDRVAVAAGFGLRYYSDFAPFRIDFGLKVYDPNDRRPISQKQFWKDVLQFHIGIGEAF